MIKDRLYWFFRNIFALIVIIIMSPFSLLITTLKLLRVVLITDGSETLSIPFEDDFIFIKKNGIKAWLTWATADQVCGLENLRWYQKLSRKFFDT